jgi:hypothetical protein
MNVLVNIFINGDWDTAHEDKEKHEEPEEN